MFNNLSNLTNKGPGYQSAYAVFNRNANAMMGSLNASQFENELRHQIPGVHVPRETDDMDLPQDDGFGFDEDENELQDDPLNKKVTKVRETKIANQPCICGSGKKYKKCCSSLRISEAMKQAEESRLKTLARQDAQEQKKWEEEWGAG